MSIIEPGGMVLAFDSKSAFFSILSGRSEIQRANKRDRPIGRLIGDTISTRLFSSFSGCFRVFELHVLASRSLMVRGV